MSDSIKNLFDKTVLLKKNSTKTELINEVLKKNNVGFTVKSIDELKLNSAKELSSIRISSDNYQRFLRIKEDLKARGISISGQEFFDYVISQFFNNP